MPDQTHNHFHGLGTYEAGGKANDSCQQHRQHGQHRHRCHQYHQHQHQQNQNDHHQNHHHQTHNYQHQHHPNQSYQNQPYQYQADQHHPSQGHQHLYGTAKYAIDDQHSCSTWRSQSSSAARYDDMNRLFAAWFPETVIELAKRSEPQEEFVPEDDAEEVGAHTANTLALYSNNQMSSFVDNTLLMPVFLDGGPTVPMLPPDGVDDLLAINAPLLDYREMLLGSGPDIDIRNWYTTDWDAGTVTRQNLIGQQGGGIVDLTMTSGLPSVERQDMAMARLPKDNGETDAKESAPVRMRRVRKGLAELETCLRAHVKDQLLQMRECH
ncbi:hypothetical protein E4U58_005713 [Claviceps cyperi]|nr:hypothetical protein E4U58_005713 [Claviceps cyperi]